MRLKILVVILCFACCAQTQAQDINFSQFYELPVLRNPALAGLFKGDIRFTSAFRSQWGSVTTPYQTTAVGTELKYGVGPNSNDYISLGLQITNDVAGDSRFGKTQALPVLTYHKSLNTERDAYLSIGFLGGLTQQRFDPSKLSFDDQFVGGAYSPTNPTRQMFNNTNAMYWDAAAGITYSSIIGPDIKFYAGASYFHFTQPKVAFMRNNDIRLNKKLGFNAGLSAPSGEFDRITLYGDYYTQGGNTQGQGGFIYTHDLVQMDESETISLSFGGFYRWNDALVPLIKLDYYKWALGITYDVNTSRLKTASYMRGGFEATLSFKSFLNIRNSSAKKTRCPVNF